MQTAARRAHKRACALLPINAIGERAIRRRLQNNESE